jgi:hypothetical protein
MGILPLVDPSPTDFSNISDSINTLLTSFVGQYWIVVPVALGVGLAIWGVRRLFSLGKSLAS